ncbi:NADPH-dependent oxidoreductase [Enterococcus camelliae]|uniref:NADPH-dependent oxidoreductase n=1 Tax=Enterococcus camelliae TaxID=453959 RepID=A0ABW5TEV9_9ENTE|nr:NADPH-dependent oxidoreductase [Enterococcus sp.]
MNTTIQQLTKHVSVRSFEDVPLDQKQKKDLLAAARSGSSSHFVQAYSILEISDTKLRSELAEITNSAPYVKQTGVFYIFLADLYRQATLLEAQGESLAGIQSMESLMVGIVDATIAAQNMVVAAESMNLGICYIGGIRNHLAKVAELLDLPRFTVPVFGLTIGYPIVKNEPKPRLPLENQVAENKYPREQFAAMQDYEQQTATYYAQRGLNPQQTSWSEKNVHFFKEVRRPETGTFLAKQGFLLQ